MKYYEAHDNMIQNNSFIKNIEKVLADTGYDRFDSFIISKITTDSDLKDGELTGQIRHKMFLLFRQKTGNREIASLPTMRRWFGINGFAVPKRQQIYEICFALSLSGNDVEEFLTVGICEPGVQFNDYHEVIYLYCLEKGLTWEDAQCMIEEFELSFDSEVEFIQTNSTNQIMKQFALKKEEDRETFMQWMLMNTASFKGYSKTALDYLNTYCSLILKHVRMDVAERLDGLLRETDFTHWLHNKKFIMTKNKGEIIRKYIRYAKKRCPADISEDLLKNIQELNKIAYTESEKGQSIISEIFTVSSECSVLSSLTGKHLSDLLNLPLQMERAIRAEKALTELEGMPENADCPKWISEFITEYTKGRQVLGIKKDAVKWLSNFKTEHRRRCHFVKRQDILSMVLYVAQWQYTEKMSHTEIKYNRESAMALFVEMANATLSACGMAALSTNFQLDALLMACFMPREMYSYEDLADVLENMRSQDGEGE